VRNIGAQTWGTDETTRQYETETIRKNIREDGKGNIKMLEKDGIQDGREVKKWTGPFSGFPEEMGAG